MDIIQMVLQILLIPNDVVPKPVLPNSSGFLSGPFKIEFTETHFESLDQFGYIVSKRIENEMQMVSKNYPGLEVE